MHSLLVIGNWKGVNGMNLAPRELEAVLHCANDRTIKEAAKEMKISPESVKKRLLNAKYKLGVNSLRAAVLQAFQLGIIAMANATPPTPKHQQEQKTTNGILIA